MKEYKFKINGNDYTVVINSVEGSNAAVTVNGANYNVEIENAPAAVAAAPAAPAAAPKAAAPAGGKTITSPLPGVIIDVNVTVGQAVKKGQKIAVLEAMKMENEILAEFDGTVTEIFIKKGDSVLEGANVVTLA